MPRRAGGFYDLDNSWYRQANCRTYGPSLFFSDDPALVREARRLCRECSQRERCLQLAMANESLDGLWGGFTAPERAALRREDHHRIAG